jgi:EAL domain-containing protein (putative c-di-GMP-specific phosphodiesterase class I)/GGDEF domain-containing protein
MAITYFDLDYFKAYNDVYGFTRGDDIIVFTAKTILNAMCEKGTPEDFLGHIGGDDFILVSDPERVDAICLAALKKYDEGILLFYTPEDRKKGFVVVENRRGKPEDFPITSISAATVTNEYKQFKHIGQLSALASELKRYAKSFKGSCYVRDRRDHKNGNQSPLVYSSETTSAGVAEERGDEVALASLFHKIITDNAIHIVFQPILNLENNAIIGHEAFCRGPKGTLLEHPQALFRMAKKTGMIRKLDQLCRERILSVSRQIKEDVLLFMNVWPESLDDPLFRSDEFLRHICRDPHTIVLELGGIDSPSAFDLYRGSLKFFQDHGFKVAIDNVGGGAVLGLGIIAEIQPAFVKLDISLMRGIHKDPIKQHTLTALSAIFTQLNIGVIAEKVELKDELDFLISTGIKYGQGYFFAKPERID